MSSNFSLLVKPAGADCNLACEYCFYLNKGKLYPNSALRMSDTVLQEYIRQLLITQAGHEVTVAWQGGEPTLMGVDFFKRSVQLVNENRQSNQKVRYSFQTNGILLNEEWCSFFKENQFLVGLSIDGPAEMHDAYRRDKGGKGSFDRVKQSWDLLKKQGVDANILCTVNASNANHPLDVYHFFRDSLKSQFIQFIPVVEQEHIRSGVQAEQYGRFLVEIFDEWVRRDVGQVFVQIFDSALASWCGLSASVCVFQETCGQSLVMEHNGDVYSCDHFVTADNLLGNIHETPMDRLADSPRHHQFGMDKKGKLPGCCRECDVFFACHGECPKNRFLRTPRGEEGLTYLCDGYRLFFHHIDGPMRIMADLWQQGRAPAEIMGIPK
jgi:uncharacterized protein